MLLLLQSKTRFSGAGKNSEKAFSDQEDGPEPPPDGKESDFKVSTWLGSLLPSGRWHCSFPMVVMEPARENVGSRSRVGDGITTRQNTGGLHLGSLSLFSKSCGLATVWTKAGDC